MLWTLLFIYFLHLQLVCGHFDQSTCGTTKKCIFVPAGCEKQGDCKQMFSYNATDDGWVNMEMTSSNDFPQYNYMAVGFSEDENMGDDPVTQCVFTNEGNANVYFSYNVGKSNTAENESLEMIHGHKGDDGMYCHFRQMSTKHNKFAPNLDREYQLFLARGLTSDPKDLGIHSLDPSSPGFPHITESKVNVGSVNKRSVAKELHSGM
ncbi:DOMON domain protein [Dictyocaulus viviparus]|uniref:DOMON domain protein n=1 Tax=Dictyocaulus viviparus TaxID=29172 RepID=A0A0D8XVJ9_DICVI|nr:DOMON domain protein [Dictyocaulus viviparus]